MFARSAQISIIVANILEFHFAGFQNHMGGEDNAEETSPFKSL